MSFVDVTTGRVRQQYEQLPYPARNPADEAHRLIPTSLDDIAVINHYGFRGERDWSRPSRFLVAGGGTGDAVVFLANQLKDYPAEITYVDLSEASMKIARERLQVRGLVDRVQWIRRPLQELSPGEIGQFDYINCSGVLHHLANPVEGLLSLVALLKPDGLLGLMVYAKYGRTGVYAMQDLFRQMISRDDPIEEQIAVARSIFAQLPKSNWQQRGHDIFAPVDQLGDTEFVDLFLHPQDRAYSIPELYDFLQQGGLVLTEFSGDSRLWYQPLGAFRDPAILNRVAQLSPSQQQAVCEAWWGCIIKHTFWASKSLGTCAHWGDQTLSPVYSFLGQKFAVALSIATLPGTDWQLELMMEGQSRVTLSLNRSPLIRRLASLIDGTITLGAIYQQLSVEFQQSLPSVERECFEMFRVLNSHDLLVLRRA